MQSVSFLPDHWVPIGVLEGRQSSQDIRVYLPFYFGLDKNKGQGLIALMVCLLVSFHLSLSYLSAYARLVGPQASMGLQALPAVLRGKTEFQMSAPCILGT